MPYDGRNYTETKPDSQVVVDLLAVRKRIEREEDWCGDQAMGYRIKPSGKGFAQCLGWTIVEVLGELEKRALAAERLIEKTAGCAVHVFNDSHTHAEVLDLLDRTIARERQQHADR